MTDEFKVWYISDTHALHGYLKVPKVDLVIHGGDATNYREAVYNHNEMLNFIEWYKGLDIEYKILVAGNHDISMSNRMVTAGDLNVLGITYLEHASTCIEGFNIFGSPFTPKFGDGWVFNKDRSKLHDLWQKIPEDSDIIVTHGPPYGILDMSDNRDGTVEHCGDRSMMKRLDVLKPTLYCSGHIHNCGEHRNAGVFINRNTVFINGSCVEDGKFNQGPTSNGVVITFNRDKKIIDLVVL